MEYQSLRERVRSHPKHEGCVEIARAPLINPGFPGTFNLSFTEDPWLKEYGKFVDFDHDYVFSAVQSCIRPEDIEELRGQNSWKYLGVFEIADLTGAIALQKRPDYQRLQREQVRSLVEFLKAIGISPDRIHPSYNAGGKIETITKGKYNFDFMIHPDNLSRDAFIESGVPESNLIGDSTRDTFLCPFLYANIPNTMPWGYRNEINVNLGTNDNPQLLDVATIEYITWNPIFKIGKTNPESVTRLEESKDGVSICAIGLERLCMAVNGLARVQDVDYIKPSYEDLASGQLLEGESLRALHRIYSDVVSHDCQPSRHQKEKIRKLLSNIPESWDRDKIKELLVTHSNSQPWHDNLVDGIEPILDRIDAYRKGRR